MFRFDPTYPPLIHFAHFQEIVGEGYRTLNEGDRVKFDVTQSPKGEKATKIERA